MVWWRFAGGRPDPDAQPVEEFPDLVAGGSRAIRADVAGRIGGYTPDWTVAAGGGAGTDPGVALVKVFGEQAAPVFAQVNLLRDKYRYEQLRIAGVVGRGPGVAQVTVVFALLGTAQDSVPIAAETQLTAPGTGGAGQVVFETRRSIFATAAALALFVVESGASVVRLEPGEVTPASPVPVFGRRPQPGSALWFGFAGPVPYPRLTMLVDLSPTDRAGGSARGGDQPVLAWELLTRDGRQPADVYADETRGLRQGGIVEVGTSRSWPLLPHPGLPAMPPAPPLRWLRVSLRHGRYDVAPRLAAIALNAVVADGAETVRDEILEPVEDPTQARSRRFRLSRAPVLPGSVRLVVDAPDPADLFDVAPPGGQEDRRTRWVEVPSLAASRPYDRHFELDEMTGIVTFGDGVRGAAVPVGFRHVRATSYRTGGGKATAVPASVGFVARGTVPFLAGIDNPLPASGGTDAETVDALVARGPDLLRARQRAVIPADVETVALDAPADVGRVVALPGRDVDGTPRPGQLTLVVVGGRRDGGPPLPTEQTLDAVAEYVADARRPLVPVGARVVTRPPRFVQVELDVVIRFDPEVDLPALLLAVARTVDAYLDPLTGGDDRQGWPLGGAIGYRRLVAVVASVTGVTSVRRIGIMVAGRTIPQCRDAALPPCTLPWPGPHLVLPLTGE